MSAFKMILQLSLVVTLLQFAWTAPTGAEAVVPEGSAFDHQAAAAPSGTYKGTTKELGVTVDATITIDDASHADITVKASGIVIVDIDCKKEGFTLGSAGKVTLGQGTAGDCMHDALQKYTVDLNSVTYNAGSDSIELSVHKILNIKMMLTGPKSQVDELLAHRATHSKMTVGETNDVLAQTLVGKSSGSKCSVYQNDAPHGMLKKYPNGDTCCFNNGNGYMQWMMPTGVGNGYKEAVEDDGTAVSCCSCGTTFDQTCCRPGAKHIFRSERSFRSVALLLTKPAADLERN